MGVQKLSLIIFLLVGIVVGGIIVYQSQQPEQPDPVSQTATTTSGTTTTPSIDDLKVLFEVNKKDLDTKLFFSTKSGIGFTFDPTPAQGGTLFASEIDRAVYVHNSDAAPNTGQWVEVFEKDPADTIDQAITKQFLKDIDPKDCFVVVSNKNQQIAPGYISATISYPKTNLQGLGSIPKQCPEQYSETNGIRYFSMHPDFPNKLLFFNIGQYSITSDGSVQGQNKGARNEWFRSVRVVK